MNITTPQVNLRYKLMFQKDLVNGIEELFDFDFDFHSQPFLPRGDNREQDFVGLHH